jgi:XTP/dITP diphosphohydrolase
VRVTLCSRNEHKRDELAVALPGWTIRLLDAVDYPPETGQTYYENARSKALYGRSVGPRDEWMLGEDSGIEVDALGGGPGVRSARSAAPGKSPEQTLLDRLVDEPDRQARMITHLVAIAPDGREVDAVGVLEGAVALEARGTAGFGYDPIFVPDGEESTVAELGDDWKRRNSHRARAAAALNAALASAGSRGAS